MMRNKYLHIIIEKKLYVMYFLNEWVNILMKILSNVCR